MHALNRRVLALEGKANTKPVVESQEEEDARCIALAGRLEKIHAEHLARNEPDPTREGLARAKQEIKELVRRLRAEDS